MGVFCAQKNDKFQLNPLGKYLVTGTSDSLGGTILGNADAGYEVWGNLLYCVKTGASSCDNSFKISVYSYLKHNSEAARNFN
jgi:hypothetical protein